MLALGEGRREGTCPMWPSPRRCTAPGGKPWEGEKKNVHVGHSKMTRQRLRKRPCLSLEYNGVSLCEYLSILENNSKQIGLFIISDTSFSFKVFKK